MITCEYVCSPPANDAFRKGGGFEFASLVGDSLSPDPTNMIIT